MSNFPAAAKTMTSVVGDIGTWAASCVAHGGVATAAVAPGTAPAALFDSEEGALQWRAKARAAFIDTLMMPALGPMRTAAVASVETGRVYELDGVKVTELSWQLPYGARTKVPLPHCHTPHVHIPHATDTAASCHCCAHTAPSTLHPHAVCPYFFQAC